MGDRSDIQWTDATWNPVTGCAKVSPGCAHCYAERVAIRLWPKQYRPILSDGSGRTIDCVSTSHHEEMLAEGTARPRRFEDVQCHEDRLDQPLRWKRPRRIFVNSMSDLFHEAVPDAFIDQVFAVMALANRHTFQVLTKRADRMKAYFERLEFEPERIEDAAVEVGDSPCAAGAVEDRGWPLPNVWLGVSVENQHFADERIPRLLQTPAAVRFISAEPLLGPVDLSALFAAHFENAQDDSTLDWVIVGGESGKDARPFDLAWARSILRQCKDAGVPCFIKQLGARPNGWWTNSLGPSYNRHAQKDSHGGDIDEWPSDLRIRQFPAFSTTSRRRRTTARETGIGS